MICYEVNLNVRNVQPTELDDWLDHHILELLELKGFESARVYKPIEKYMDACPPSTCQRTVHYYLDSQESLDDYLQNNAAKMREKGIATFGQRLSATRRVFSTSVSKQADEIGTLER